MDTVKNFFGFGGEAKAESDSAVNKSMYVPHTNDKLPTKPGAKEDPGPTQGRMISYKRSNVKTVTENKKRIDQRATKNMDRGKWKQMEQAVVKRETEAKQAGIDLDISYSQLTTDLVKIDDDKELAIIKEGIRYLHHAGSMVRKLEKHEQGLNFPMLANRTKEETDLVQHLKGELSRQGTEAKQLQEQVDLITKERNKALEDLVRDRTELDTKSKKIAELNYNNRCANTKIQEVQKQFLQASKALEEIKRMHSEELSKAMKELRSLKEERVQLKETLEEERAARKRIERENEDMQKESNARLEELRTSRAFNTTKPPGTLNESVHQQLLHADGAFTFRMIMDCQNVVSLVTKMLEPKEIMALMGTSKKINEIVTGNKATWMHTIRRVTVRAKGSLKAMEEKMELLKNSDKRFAFLKSTEGPTDEEMKLLIDDYICKNKRLGESLVKSVLDCKSFIYTGELYQEGKKQVALTPVKEEPGNSNTSGGGMFGTLTGWIWTKPGTVPAKEAERKDEDPTTVLADVITSEKTTTVDSITLLLRNKMAKASQDQVMRWVFTLQRCFVVLFKTTLNFYCEAHDVERLKDFLSGRFGQLKGRNKELHEESKKFEQQLQEQINTRTEILKTVKELNTQIVVLNNERTKDKNQLANQEKELKEMREYQTKALGELTDQKRLLIKEVKSLRKKISSAEEKTSNYLHEFELLREMIGRAKEAYQDDIKTFSELGKQ